MVEVHLRIHPTVENVTAQSQSVELVHTSVREQGEIQFRRAVLSAEHHGEAVFRCQTLVPRTQPTNGDTGILLGTGPPIRKEQFETGGPFAVQQRVGIDARGGTPKVLGRHHDADGRNVRKRVSQSVAGQCVADHPSVHAEVRRIIARPGGADGGGPLLIRHARRKNVAVRVHVAWLVSVLERGGAQRRRGRDMDGDVCAGGHDAVRERRFAAVHSIDQCGAGRVCPDAHVQRGEVETAIRLEMRVPNEAEHARCVGGAGRRRREETVR